MINCGNGPSLTISGDAMTIEAWAYLNEDIAPQWGTGIAYKEFSYSLIQDWDASRRFTFEMNADTRTWTSDTNKDLYRWYHVVGVYDGTNTYIYVDGFEISSAANTGNIDATAFPLYIGKGDPDFFNGRIDEVRLLNIDKSAEWIATEFSNQDNPSSFYSIGAETILQAEFQQDVQVTDFQYKKDFVVDHTKVSEDLFDFPMLIDIFDTDLRTDVQPDGDDIMFKGGYIWCPHEIAYFDQTYNETHAHLIAWVKTDLSSSIDTRITMYYGNPELTAQENPSAVWSGYVGAWHLDETPTGPVYDSSPYSNDGTTLGAMSGSALVLGQIGSGFELDGIDDMINISESSSLDSIKSAGTLSIWLNWVNVADGGYQRVITTSDRFILNPSPPPTLLQDDGLEWAVQPDGDHFFYPWGGNSTNYNFVPNPFTNNIWHHLVVTLDYSTKSVLIYLDGAPLVITVENVPTGWTQLASLGDWLWGGNNVDPDSHFLGKFDEIRVTGAVRSSEWISTEYNNQYDPSSFYSIGSEEEISGGGYIFTTSSETSVTIGTKLSLGVQMTTQSYADDFTLGTSFSIVNGSLPIWTAGVLVSPPPELNAISLEVEYPEGEWWPFSVKSPSGVEMTFATDWTCFEGKLIVGSTAIDEYGMWQIQFLDRNHVLDQQMGPAGGPYSTTDQFTLGQDIQFRVWSSGTIGSTISLELTDPSGSTWYTGATTFQGQRFTLPYYHRKQMTISHTNVVDDLVNFPVLVDIYDTDLRTDVRPDGRDIAFAISEETLSHEIELFDQAYNLTHAHLVAWVNVPLLSSSTDTVLDMYYGNPLAPIVYDTGPVWDSDYVGVWHLGESGAGLSGEYTDSSLYKNHGQGGNGTVSYVPSRVVTPIGYGQNFTNHFIDCGNATSLDITGNQITLQLWMQYPSATHPNMGPFNHKGWYDGYRFIMSQNSQNMRINLGPKSTGGTYDLSTSQVITPNEWHHVVATYDGSLVKFYIDGNQDAATMVMTTNILSALPDPFRIGHGDQPEAKAWTYPWIGQIDEVRISSIARSGAWIQTEYENQNNPNSFYSVGAEENIGYSESAPINLDTSAPAGVWHATARYSDGSSIVYHRVGMLSRSFIVKRGVSLSLTAPGDAIADGISTKLIGEQLYVEFELEDTLTAAMVSGATVSMNWSVSGVPTNVQFNDYGNGRYGKTLNTSDLGSYGRLRLDLEASHQFYTNATDFFYLDLSHKTFLTYEPPPDAPYGDNFEIRLTLKDQFDNVPLTGATISSNATILGVPTDYGNGTYLVTVDSTGFSIGEHTFKFTATPSTSYLLSSNIDVQFSYRPIATETTPLSPDAVEAPWGLQANTSIYWSDVDHADIGVEGGSLTISPFVQTQTFEAGGGFYDITIDVSSFAPGTYFFNLTYSKLNYQSSTTTISIIVTVHRTSLSVNYNSTIPVGTDAYLDVSWLDLDLDSITVGSGNLSQIFLDWGTGSDSFSTFGFWLDTSGWAIGSYSINVSVSATESPKFYMDSYIIIQLEIRKLKVYLSWDPFEPFPNGNDFVMFIYVNVSEPGSLIDGTPITELDQSYFSARNETGGLYTFLSFANLGNGRYQITINSTRFLEGQYKIIVFVDFLPTENFTDTNTPQVPFTYRPILTYLSSPNYPTVTTSFDTNVTITLSYVDIDNVQNITTGTITSEGASILWQHIGNGVYEVLIIVQGWDLGAHEVNITADATSYQAKTLTFQILVQIAYAYARSSDTVIDLPLGDTAVFYVDYWDITHDEPILGATINHNWTYPLVVTWTGDQYRIELPSIDTDALGSYLVVFNFSKGPNYQFGYLNISIILRTHLTEFRLASAVEPTSYNAMVNISVYCGDLDNNAGIIDASVNLSIYGDSGWILSTYENDTALGNGYYIIRFAATNLGPDGIYGLTIHFNWTGPVQKFYDFAIITSVRIIGEASELSLIDSAEPTPFLGNLSYTYFYSELYSGNGISNVSAPAGNVFIYVEFLGRSISSSLFTIAEDLGNLGHYTIEFNSTILDGPGVYTMIVYVNWSKGVEPGYGNWTDTVSVRIIPRSTLINLIPPESTPFGVNATFSFSFDDVAESTTERIPLSSQMTITISLPDYSITYNMSEKQFLVSFNTSILGAPLGSRQFTIGVSWSGAPYYANVTGRTVIINVRFRETEFDYSTISPTSYGDNVTLHFTFNDITLGIPQAIDDGSVTLYNGSVEIPASEYSFMSLGNGEYEIELKTTYFSRPGTYSISVEMSTSHFYYAIVTASRTLSLRYRLTVLLVEPVAETPYNNSLEVVVHYSDVLTLAEIGNSSTPTAIRILNGSSWLFSSVWRGASEDYLLTIQTYNQGLEINREYVLLIEISYADSAPFYLSAEAVISFTLQERQTNLDITSSPEPTQYLENINFTVYYQDSSSLEGISGAIITLTVGGADLIEGVDYVLQNPSEGIYYISLNTTALGPAGTIVNLILRASWTSSAPFYSTSSLSLTLSVTQRNSITEILSSITQVKFLENVTFTIRYSDEVTGKAIQFSKNQLLIYSEGGLLLSNDFSMNYLGSSYRISINSSVLNVGLISNWNITFYIDWQDNVVPYYLDGRASSWVNVVNRIGIVNRDLAPTVPIHDNMTLGFTYVDDSTGLGINDAIVQFDCVSPSGLIEGVDFWIFRIAGNYSILVDTSSLGSTGTFAFSLRLLWSSTLSPYYRNTTTILLQGTVRLIQVQLTNEEPSPSTVPLNDNVSVILNLQDMDHDIPIAGAESSFSVRYKTNASGPAIWSITQVSPGVYELVVDCSDAGATGTNSFIITLSISDYQIVEIQVPFQIRLRQGELNDLLTPSAYFGDTTYVIVELVDKDAANAPISGATLTITWPDVGYTPDYTSIGPGLYNITLTTASLDAGLYTLVVGAQVSDYFISDISVPVQIQSIPTGLILPQTVPDVYWGEDVSIWALFNNTRDNILISGASLVYQFGVLSGSLTEVILDPGNYSITVDTGNLAVATTYVISITATLKNYVTITRQLTVNVLKLPIGLILVSDAQPVVFKGSPVNITVFVNNTYSNTPLLGATIEVSYQAQGPQTMFLSPVPGMDGYYTGFVATDDLFVGDYVLTITARRTNYLIATSSATVTIEQIPTVVWLDALTSTYNTRTFNWSDTIRIGIYALAPSLNESYPLSTGLANCTIVWSLSGTAFTGEFLNGTSIGGPGYFYFDFETWDYSASTYTLRITAYPNIGMFAYSSNLTTLIIEPIETSVDSTYLSPKIWGWTGWVNLTYWDLLFDRGIAGANILVDWDGVESIFRYVGNGTYQIFINASLVKPGIYPVSVRFLIDNYKTGTGVFTLNVREVPTSITVFAPTHNQIENDVLNLQVPYGDTLPITMFYNDTWYNKGIPGATNMTGVILGAALQDPDYLLIQELTFGNYSLLLDTTRWEVSQVPYRLILSLYLANWSRATINIEITIIDVPTALQIQIDDIPLTLSYGQEYSIWVFYYDNWTGHAGQGIAGASINATSLDDRYVRVSWNQSDPSRPGWYEIRIRSQRRQGSAFISIILSKDNFESAIGQVAISVEPSDFDVLIERVVIYGIPVGLILLVGAVLWTRLFSVPKRLREIRGMVRDISKGKMPHPPANIPSRQEIVANLFNDIAGPIGIKKAASSMPIEAIATAVPEIEVLLVQLSILTKLTPEELEDFKLDVSKMKLSEQVNFVKEVINQEAIKKGRIERKPMETVLEETAAMARAVLAGEEIEQFKEPEPVEVRVEPELVEKPEEIAPEPADFEDVDVTDMLTDDELKEIRQRLVDAGIKGSELETIMDQTRELPRELAEELLKSILGKGGEDK
ncbi:MAG: LamG-like jellyroll fold domain-containing protein [Candidatus Sifarchaeia archaeon]